MAEAVLVATFIGGSVGQQQDSGDMQTKQSNQGDHGHRGPHWVLAYNGDSWLWHWMVSSLDDDDTTSNQMWQLQENNHGKRGWPWQ